MPRRRSSKKESALSKIEKEIADRQASLQQEMLKLRVVIEESPKKLEELREREMEERLSSFRGRTMDRQGSLVDPRHISSNPKKRVAGERRGGRHRGVNRVLLFQFIVMSIVLVVLLIVAIRMIF